MRNLDQVFDELQKSRFRQGFRLGLPEQAYLRDKGVDTVLDHARDFVAKRLAPANPARDGKQTPYRGHPVFIAQHATATCCRNCLEKWHRISKGHALDPGQQDYVVSALARWLRAASDRRTR